LKPLRGSLRGPAFASPWGIYVDVAGTLPTRIKGPAHGDGDRGRHRLPSQIKTNLEIEDQNFMLRRRISVQQPCRSDHKSVIALINKLKMI
jgi:hypothetical protein